MFDVSSTSNVSDTELVHRTGQQLITYDVRKEIFLHGSPIVIYSLIYCLLFIVYRLNIIMMNMFNSSWFCSILTGMATLALPSIPSSSIVTLVMVLTSLNIPAGHISLLFAVEWYLWVLSLTWQTLIKDRCLCVQKQMALVYKWRIKVRSHVYFGNTDDKQ